MSKKPPEKPEGKPTAKAPTASKAKELLAGMEAALKTLGAFQEQDLDPRVIEAFTASGGKVLKKWMAGADKLSAEVTFSVNAAEDAVTRIQMPVTLPLKRAAFEKVAADLLMAAN